MSYAEPRLSPSPLDHYLLRELEAVQVCVARREFEPDRPAAEGRERRVPPDRMPQRIAAERLAIRSVEAIDRLAPIVRHPHPELTRDVGVDQQARAFESAFIEASFVPA